VGDPKLLFQLVVGLSIADKVKEQEQTIFRGKMSNKTHRSLFNLLHQLILNLNGDSLNDITSENVSVFERHVVSLEKRNKM